jgi:hypothetical protein
MIATRVSPALALIRISFCGADFPERESDATTLASGVGEPSR